MSKLRITTTLAAVLFAASAPLAMAQTTSAGNGTSTLSGPAVKDAPGATTGRSESSTKMTTSGAPSTGAATGESKTTATGGQPGGRADKN